jgi:aminopeptidase
MKDLRYQKLAYLLANYSLGIKEGDEVWFMGELGALPLYTALYEEVIKAGGHVFTTLSFPGWQELFFKHATKKQLEHMCPFSKFVAERCNKRVRIIGSTNTRALSQVPSDKQSIVSKANQPLMAISMDRSAKGELDWVVSLCPTEGLAQEANSSLLDYEDFVFKAGFLDQNDPVASWKEQERKQKLMVDYLNTKKELHFKTPHGTDLHVNIEGMKWMNSCGKRNFPDGEVFTGPNLEAADGGINGVVHYTYPAILKANVVEGVRLTFENGRVVDAKATKNEAFLKAMIEQDEGASTLGEIAIGTNYAIDTFTQNILFDEKIGGTFHAALGAGYPETGNKNISGLHWDMICDLRDGGEIFADGELISKNGRFENSDWPSL